MTWPEERERRKRPDGATSARDDQSAARTLSEDRRLAYHREAAFKAPWTGTDAYTFMRNRKYGKE